MLKISIHNFPQSWPFCASAFDCGQPTNPPTFWHLEFKIVVKTSTFNIFDKMSSRTILCCWLSRRASCTCSTWTATPTRRTTWPWRRRRSSTRWRSWQGNGRKTLKLLSNPTGSQLFQKKNLLPIFCSPGSAWATLVTTVGFWKPDGANLAGGTSFGSRKTLSPSWREFDRERCFFIVFFSSTILSDCKWCQNVTSGQ